MFQTESVPMASDYLQSIRSSCDRCRLQKLKCTVQTTEPNGRLVCERCVRAKVPCIFGRRRRASRPSETKKRVDASTRPSTMPPVQETGAISPPISAPTSTEYPSSGVATATIAAPGTPPDRPTECEPEAPPPYHDHQRWESLTPTYHNTPSDMECHQSSMTGWDWLDQGFTLDDVYGLEADLMGTTPGSASSGSLTPSLLTEGAATIRDSSKFTGSAAAQRLPALIAEMQQRLETLENGSWLYDNARSFDRYPIGTVLRLSQEFGTLAGQALSMAMTYGADAKDTHTMAYEKATPTETGIALLAGEGDTAAVLLVLGGYLSLVRLYSLVLGHFQAHLSRIPSGSLSMAAGHGGQTSPIVNTSPTLQLGELPSAGAMPDLSRIHAALGMLLAALHGVEEQLGRGGEIARDMVVALLTQSSGIEPIKLRDGLGGLGEKVRSVKELLREKMDL